MVTLLSLLFSPHNFFIELVSVFSTFYFAVVRTLNVRSIFLTIFFLNKFLISQYSIGKYKHNILQQTSGTYLSCITETLYFIPVEALYLLKSNSHSHTPVAGNHPSTPVSMNLTRYLM